MFRAKIKKMQTPNDFLQRLVEIGYPGATKLNIVTLLTSGQARYDVLEWILLQFHQDLYFARQLFLDGENDARERDILYACAMLGLCTENNLALVQGSVDSFSNVQFLNRLLDLLVAQCELEQDKPLSLAFDQDSALVKLVSMEHDVIFAQDCRLFSNDIMSKLPKLASLYIVYCLLII